MVKVSCVMPVHNEAKYLPYSLGSLVQLEDGFDEYIFVLDNCKDGSKALVNADHGLNNCSVFTLDGHRWNFYAAESFQTGFDIASGDVIFACGADLVIDPKIPGLIRDMFRDPKVGTVCFRYINYDLHSLKVRLHGFYDNVYRSMIQRFRKAVRHSGVYAFRRQMMLEIGGLADIVSEYDEYCLRAQKCGWKVLYVGDTKILHLRVGLTPRKQFIQGVARTTLPRYNLTKTLFHSFVHFKPHLIVGYLQAKRYGAVEAGKLR